MGYLWGLLVDRLRVRAERMSRARVEIEHMAAAIESQLRPHGIAHLREMVEHVATDRIGRDHVAVAVSDEQPERRRQRKQRAQIIDDVGAKSSGTLPVPFARYVGRQEVIGHL